jgi:hypothetical protein
MSFVASREGKQGRLAWAGPILAVLMLFSGCGRQTQPVYQDQRGFHFTPPSGFVERVREDAIPARSSHRQDVPLPPLVGPGNTQERLLVRYDRLTSEHAWLRVSVADVPSATSLPACLINRSPGRDWKREANVESLEVSGLPAARVVQVGRWSGKEYVNETVAVRSGEQVYFITASFPASDSTAREQVRQAIAAATWQ